MWASGKRVSGLVQLFGQQKSTVYYDIKFIAKIIIKALEKEWISMPDPNTTEYNQLLGAGVLSDDDGNVVWPKVPYIMDVSCVCVLF